MTYYLDEDDVLEFAEDMLGFPVVVRDRGLLASAVFRPQSGYGDQDIYPDLWTKAAALGEGIARNHPLVDANKRTAWSAMRGFLTLNGVPLEAVDDDAAEEFMLTLAQGNFTDINKAAEALRQLF